MAAFVGVDIGTTSTKVIAYSQDGTLLTEESGGYALRSPRPGWAEQDPGEILEVVLDALAEVVQAVKNERRGEISGVSFSAAMHSLLALDVAGVPMTPAITFADNRASEQAAGIRDEMDGGRFTGARVHPYIRCRP